MTEDEEELYLEELEFQDLARNSLAAFTHYTKPNYRLAWFHNHLCKKLDAFARGEITRLMVFMPPRHGKSELVSRRLPAYLLGRNPDAQIIATSYNAGLAQKMNRDVQKIIQGPEYQRLFPEVRLAGKNIQSTEAGQQFKKTLDEFEVVDRDGVYRCAGVGGGITGTGGDFLLIDDPIKDMATALSPTYRNNLWDWYNSTLLTRLESEFDTAKDGGVLVMHTRWHEDDLAGRLLLEMKNNPDADKWEVICFPAIKEDNENPDDPREIGGVLWPEKYPIAKLKKFRANHLIWNGLYQQRPSFKSGNVLRRKDWRFYDLYNPPKFDEVIMSWDMSFEDEGTAKDPDFVSCSIWGKTGAQKYLLGLTNEKLDFTDTLSEFRTMVAKYPQAFAKLVEKKANGPAIISALSKEITGIIPINPQGSKESRVAAVSPQVRAGNVFLPDPMQMPLVADFISQCAEFPKSKNDDMVDSMTQAFIYWQDGAADEWTEDFTQKDSTIAGANSSGW